MVRAEVDTARERIAAGDEDGALTGLVDAVISRVSAIRAAGPSPVINATGTLLHTNLGRAPLSISARRAMERAAGTSDLEFSVATGRRANRQDHVASLLQILLGVESALFVNSNAAALLLAMRTLCNRKEVIVSRGELVEIGDGFRIPDILREGGARIHEVGTTNRTVLDDYGEAVSERSAAVLSVHTSNFEVVGFVGRPGMSELANLAHERGLPFIVDNGSGALVDTAMFGLRHEPTPKEAIEFGADVVLFSTDKLLGGPQGGVIAGRRSLITRMSRHPLARCLRPDKIAIAGLRATLQSYVECQECEIPVIRMLAATEGHLRERASAMATQMRARGIESEIVACESTVGGGSLPLQTLPSVGLLLRTRSFARTAKVLRTLPTPVITRSQGGAVLLDLRTVDPVMDDGLVAAVCTSPVVQSLAKDQLRQ